MAGAEAHGVTKTTPNATQRLCPPALWLLYDWAKLPAAPFDAALGPTLRLMTSREATDCGLY